MSDSFEEMLQKYYPDHLEGDCRPDPGMIEAATRGAQTITPEESAALREQALPPAVDWSRYLTLIRHQGTTSTCIMQALVAGLDILKERERRFSPNHSAWWLVYGYWSCATGELPPDPVWPREPGIGQGGIAIKYGCCSEASYSSRINLSLSPPTSPPVPTNDQRREAAGSKLKSQDLKTNASVADLKGYINMGPVWQLFGGHAMTFVGYDDSTSQFKLVNSYGDVTNGGFQYISYQAMAGMLPNMLLRPMVNQPTPPTSYVYTGQIKLSHNQNRNHVTVAVGVEGHPEVEVWGLPGSTMAGDQSRHLVFNFPLPSYAGTHWPPSDINQWFVRVTDHTPNPSNAQVGTIEDLVLVHRGAAIPILYRMNVRNVPIRRGFASKFYIPTRKRTVLSLAGPAQVHAGEHVNLGGTLSLRMSVADNYVLSVPIANKKIAVYQTEYDPIEGTIFEAEIGETTTDPYGKYQVSHVPQATSDYESLATEPNNQVIATSNTLKITVL